ncbi:MAG: type I-E CRISPR-associated protein Cas6/Cse3/CasE [Syntrophomonadaceae bacterium]|nr:type I-E CRISPR-associated protein Cas6/Cse3/CasE [Syntrophomonadaceae bacterium]
MMYLSKIYMDMTHPMARRDLNNCHSMHQTVMSAFSQSECSTTARSERNILYRIFPMDGSKIILYIQSSEEPDIGKWASKGQLIMESFDHLGVKEIPDPVQLFNKGMLLDFDLLASPCKKTGSPLKEERLQGNCKNGRRAMLRTSEERIAWLKRRAEHGGFSVLTAWEAGSVSVVGSNNKGDSIKLTGIRFRGTLAVTDVEVFSNTFQMGIGPGKAYGYGLLMVSLHH